MWKNNSCLHLPCWDEGIWNFCFKKWFFFHLLGSSHVFSLGTLLENPHKEKHLHHYHYCQKNSLACKAENVPVLGSRDANSLKSPDLKMNQTSFNFGKWYARFNYSMEEERHQKATFSMWKKFHKTFSLWKKK